MDRGLPVLLLVLGFVASGMAAGESDAAEGTFKEELKAFFSSTRHGATLAGALVAALVTYYINVAKVTKLDEIDVEDATEVEEAAEEAWSHAHSEVLPRAHAHKLRKWVLGAVFPSTKAKETLAGTTHVGDVAEEDRRHAAKEATKDLDLSPFEKEKVQKDMAAQGLSCARIVGLSLSLTLGKVSKMSVSQDMKYGEDPALSEPVKQARKAGKKILAVVIKEKKYEDAGSFFSDLMRSYADIGMTIEASLVATWWAETSGCFSAEKESLFQYLEEYFDKYAGRGLPVMVDTVLVTRIRNAAGSGAGVEVKTLRSDVAELKAANLKLKNRLEALENKVKDNKKKPTTEEQEERRKNVVCHNCGKKGHYQSECPEKKKDADE